MDGTLSLQLRPHWLSPLSHNVARSELTAVQSEQGSTGVQLLLLDSADDFDLQRYPRDIAGDFHAGGRRRLEVDL